MIFFCLKLGSIRNCVLQLKLMVVVDGSVWFFFAYVSEIRGPHPFVRLQRVFDVLSLCSLLVPVSCPLEVHLVQ